MPKQQGWREPRDRRGGGGWDLQARGLQPAGGAGDWPEVDSGCSVLVLAGPAQDWQDWEGRGVARVARRQNVATPAGSRVARK